MTRPVSCPALPKHSLSGVRALDRLQDLFYNSLAAEQNRRPQPDRTRHGRGGRLTRGQVEQEGHGKASHLITTSAMEKATQIMLAVHTRGKAVCGVYTRDVAETRAEQVNAYSREHEQPLLCNVEVES